MISMRKMTPRWIKTSVRMARWPYRYATSGRRSLPDFLIIGAQKSGTTSLYSYLAQHPQVSPSYRKEVHYFDGGMPPETDSFSKGEKWYRAHFPYKSNSDNSPDLTFEASPLYIFHPLAAERIYGLIPQAKIICVLRNPVQRAVSHYFHEKRKGREPLSIVEAMEKEESRISHLIQNKDYNNPAFIQNSYKTRGHYAEQLERYYRLFPKNNIHVINSEDLFSDPCESARKVFEFLGVDNEIQLTDTSARNSASNRVDIPPELYEELDCYYREYNEDLYRLIGCDLGW